MPIDTKRSMPRATRFSITIAATGAPNPKPPTTATRLPVRSSRCTCPSAPAPGQRVHASVSSSARSSAGW